MNTVHPSHSPTKLIMMLVSTAASHGEDTAYAESQWHPQPFLFDSKKLPMDQSQDMAIADDPGTRWLWNSSENLEKTSYFDQLCESEQRAFT